jgi:methyltransferase (TIGR00027 family)
MRKVRIKTKQQSIHLMFEFSPRIVKNNRFEESRMPPENLIQHVSDTAYWIAAYRAKESARPDALFHDPLAAKLAKGHGEAIVAQMEKMGSRKPMEWSVAIRTIVIDNYIKAAINHGVDLVLNLGAGLDTRPYRLDLAQGLQWIEVDFPAIISLKEKALQDEKPRCQLQRVAIDLSDEAARGSFLDQVNAKAKKVLILTEGVVPYLSLDEAAALAKDLARQSHFNFWVTDYFSAFFMQLYAQGKVGMGIKENAPFRFAPENWEQFFASKGWAKQELRFLSEEGERLSRPAPAPFIFKMLKLVTPKSKFEKFKNMYGYALLRRQ